MLEERRFGCESLPMKSSSSSSCLRRFSERRSGGECAIGGVAGFGDGWCSRSSGLGFDGMGEGGCAVSIVSSRSSSG